MLQLVVLSKVCWQHNFECHSGNSFQINDYSCNPYVEKFQNCTKTVWEIVRHISRSGVNRFLISTFLISPHDNLIPMKLAKLLYNYPRVSRLMCQRKSEKAESNYFRETSILVLLASNMFHMKMKEKENPKVI